MIKKKSNYEVTTKAKCLEDVATEKEGSTAYTTFMTEDKEYSNDYIIPFHSICDVKVKVSQDEYEVDDPTCQGGDEPTPPAPGEPHIDGATNTSIRQGTDFDLNEGVKAYDGEGNEIPFTVTPSEVAKCDVGEQTFTYEAEGVTKERKITVTQIANPTISGLSELTVEVGEEFDPLDGVSAVDGNGNPVEVTYERGEEELPLLTSVSNITITNGRNVSIPITNPSALYDGNVLALSAIATEGGQPLNWRDVTKEVFIFSDKYAYQIDAWMTSPYAYFYLDLTPAGGVPTNAVVGLMSEQDPEEFPDEVTIEKLEVRIVSRGE